MSVYVTFSESKLYDVSRLCMSSLGHMDHECHQFCRHKMSRVNANRCLR